MKKFLFIFVVLVVILIGCSVSGETPEKVDEPRTGTNSSSSQESADSEEPATEEDEAEVDDGVFSFGEQVRVADVLVTVSRPKPFKPGEWSFGGEDFDNHVKFTINIVNDGDKPYDPSLFMTTLQSGNTEADEVYDDSMGGSPNTKVLPGREVEFTVGYGVQNPKDLVMEVTPEFLEGSVIFTN